MSNSNSPKAWSRFISQTRESDNEERKKLVGDFGELARWSARFRLAKSFKGLDLGDSYSGLDTPQLYSAIMRIFLVYSAFETYCRIIGLNPSDETKVKSLQDSQEQEKIIKAIRKLDRENAVFKFLVQHLTGKHLKQLICDFNDGKEVNVSCLARSIRHIFAHGILAATSTGLSPKRFDKVSKLISDFLLNCMDQDFDKRVP
ncbi:MAG: hypothetical protein NT070_20870 [Cyanobacteria bacterium]|nr:hypothetical protein [Cyanobacteriota bacterium]